jgi:hypothetical protein
MCRVDKVSNTFNWHGQGCDYAYCLSPTYTRLHYFGCRVYGTDNNSSRRIIALGGGCTVLEERI